MAEIFELGMLVCFGFSWPLSVIKNYKAGTAKTMSLSFILLILSGYVSGILSKFLSGNITYVLVVYFINLFFVSLNVVIYFINRKKDKERDKGKTMLGHNF